MAWITDLWKRQTPEERQRMAAQAGIQPTNLNSLNFKPGILPGAPAGAALPQQGKVNPGAAKVGEGEETEEEDEVEGPNAWQMGASGAAQAATGASQQRNANAVSVISAALGGFAQGKGMGDRQVMADERQQEQEDRAEARQAKEDTFREKQYGFQERRFAADEAKDLRAQEAQAQMMGRIDQLAGGDPEKAARLRTIMAIDPSKGVDLLMPAKQQRYEVGNSLVDESGRVIFQAPQSQDPRVVDGVGLVQQGPDGTWQTVVPERAEPQKPSMFGSDALGHFVRNPDGSVEQVVPGLGRASDKTQIFGSDSTGYYRLGADGNPERLVEPAPDGGDKAQIFGNTETGFFRLGADGNAVPLVEPRAAKPEKTEIFGSAETGYFRLGADGNPVPLVEPRGPKPEAPINMPGVGLLERDPNGGFRVAVPAPPKEPEYRDPLEVADPKTPGQAMYVDPITRKPLAGPDGEPLRPVADQGQRPQIIGSAEEGRFYVDPATGEKVMVSEPVKREPAPRAPLTVEGDDGKPMYVDSVTREPLTGPGGKPLRPASGASAEPRNPIPVEGPDGQPILVDPVTGAPRVGQDGKPLRPAGNANGGPEQLEEVYDPNSPTGTSLVPRSQAAGKPGKPGGGFSMSYDERGNPVVSMGRTTGDKPVPADMVGKVAGIEGGLEDVGKLNSYYFPGDDPGTPAIEGDFSRSGAVAARNPLPFVGGGPVPFSEGGSAAAQMGNAIDSIVRLRTGAGLTASEPEYYRNLYQPGLTDNTETARTKLGLLQREMETAQKLFDERKGNRPRPAAPEAQAAAPPAAAAEPNIYDEAAAEEERKEEEKKRRRAQQDAPMPDWFGELGG